MPPHQAASPGAQLLAPPAAPPTAAEALRLLLAAEAGADVPNAASAALDPTSLKEPSAIELVTRNVDGRCLNPTRSVLRMDSVLQGYSERWAHFAENKGRQTKSAERDDRGYRPLVPRNTVPVPDVCAAPAGPAAAAAATGAAAADDDADAGEVWVMRVEVHSASAAVHNPKRSQEFEVRERQPLTALRDRLYCMQARSLRLVALENAFLCYEH